MKRSDLDTLTVLRAIEAHGMDAYEHLAMRYPPKIVIAAIERDVQAGLLDYGVSVRRPWLEPAGRARLKHTMNEPRLYVVDLGTGEVAGGPESGTVQHCNSRTGYEMIVHPYAPDECDHCAELREMGYR